jgi:hypothetical protein
MFVGDYWSDEHHDIELMDAAGHRLSKACRRKERPRSRGCMADRGPIRWGADESEVAIPDAHVLADMMRTDSRQQRPVAGDSPEAEAIRSLPGRT